MKVRGCKEFGLTISQEKAVGMSSDICIGDHTIEVVEQVIYIGSDVSANGSLETEIGRRTRKGHEVVVGDGNIVVNGRWRIGLFTQNG